MRILVSALAALALAPAALSGGPRMEIGSVLEEAEQPTFAEAQQRVALADQAALGGAYRFSITWSRRLGRRARDDGHRERGRPRCAHERSVRDRALNRNQSTVE